MEIETSKHHTKAEMQALFPKLVGSLDIEIEDATKGWILHSPNGTRWRRTIDNNGIETWTSL